MEVSEQYIFSINGMFFWIGYFNTLTYKSYISIEFSLESKHTSTVFAIDKYKNALYKSNILFSVHDHLAWQYYQKGKDYFSDRTFTIVQLPPSSNHSNVSLSWIKPSSCRKKLVRTAKPIYSFYVDDFVRLYDILEKYIAFGIPIDMKEELNRFKMFPDFLPVCCPILERILDSAEKMRKMGGDPSTSVVFQVTARYEKQFYCAVKLADHAVDIKTNTNRSAYQVTYTGNQLNEIRLMHDNLTNPFNNTRDDIVFAREYLASHDSLTYITTSLAKFEAAFQNIYGFYSFIHNSVIHYLQSAVHMLSRTQLNTLYQEMISEGRVKSKWVSEYKLYELLSRIFPDAIYQYHSLWLGLQSLDIFIPTLALAVEYQGIQHFEAVDHFEGETGLSEQIVRDNLKRRLCSSKGIRLLEWKYDRAVTWDNVLDFLKENSVDVPNSCTKESDSFEIKVNSIVPDTSV